MFHVYTGIAYLYVLWRFIFQISLPRGWRVLLAILLLLASQHHLLSRLIFGTMFSPEIPRYAVIFSGWGFFSFVLILVSTIAIDLVKFCLLLSGYKWQHSAKILGAASIVAMVISAYGIDQAIRVPEVKRIPLAIKGLPPALTGFKLVQLSDLHISRLFSAPWTQAVVDKTLQLNPDLIVVTGDLIDGTVANRKNDVAALAKLRARYGVFAITGNHEYYFQAQDWISEFQQLGMRVLTNEHVVIDVAETRLTVAGITDPIATSYGMVGPDIGSALRGAPAGGTTILLAHRPIGAAQNAAQGVSLQLSGHTHGGMLMGLNLLASYANEGHVSGLYQVDSMNLYVSNGTGLWNGFPVRIGVPAEITEFILEPQN